MTRRETNRNRIQDYAVYLSTKFKHVVLSWATGVGKSLAAIRIIDNDIKTNTEECGEWSRWYIVVAERQHIKNWEDDIRKHKFDHLLDLGYIEIFCYNSLHKYKGREANLILDEAHSVTDLRLDCLSTIKYKKIVSLSATLEREREVQLTSLLPFHKYTITTDKAIKADLLPSPIIVKVDFMLTPKLKQEYDYLSSVIDGSVIAMKSAQMRLEEIIRVFPESPKIKSLKTEITTLDSEILKQRVRRKNLLANAKTTSVERLQKQMEAWRKKYIIFTGSLPQTRKLGEKKGIDISSDHVVKVNEDRINTFNNASLGGLICYKMLRQGTNLTGIQMGVIVQLDAKQLSFIQMMGRIFRSTRPVLFVYVTKDTVDEVYWEECSKDLDKSYIISYPEFISKYGKEKEEG